MDQGRGRRSVREQFRFAWDFPDAFLAQAARGPWKTDEQRIRERNRGLPPIIQRYGNPDLPGYDGSKYWPFDAERALYDDDLRGRIWAAVNGPLSEEYAPNWRRAARAELSRVHRERQQLQRNLTAALESEELEAQYTADEMF